MKGARRNRKARWLALLAALSAAWGARGQQRLQTYEEPQMFKLRVTDVSVGLYGEGIIESDSLRGGSTITHDRFFLGPFLGLNASGSIYHPNLIAYQLTSEGAYGVAQDTISTPAGKQSRLEWDYLGRFLGNVNFLADKPLRGNFYGGYDHSYRDYDFFTRVTVDSWRYGGGVTYDRRPWSVGANYSHRDEDISGLTIASITHEDVVGVHARQDRARGGTSIEAAYGQYNRVDQGRPSEAQNYNVALGDTERFGSRDQMRLNSSLSYSKQDTLATSSDQLTAAANLDIEHRENLSSFYDAGYERYQSGDLESDSYHGSAGLRHQLYESLGSSLNFYASDTEASDSQSSGYTRRYGVQWSEIYQKHLTDQHHLTLNNVALVEHVDQKFQVAPGAFTTVERERHTFAEMPGEQFRLSLPDVIASSIVVFDSAHVQQYQRVLDYEVVQNGAQTFIQRLPGSTIPEGALVLVDYEAEPLQSGSYENFSDSVQVRLDLWKSLWGIYARMNLSLNNAPDIMRIQQVRDYVFGTDFRWRWFRAGAEYEIYDSDQTKFNATRLYQSVLFKPDLDSSLSLNFSESWLDYIEAGRREENYRFISRYHRALTRHLGLDLEGGVNYRRGQAIDSTLATARAAINYVAGKLSVGAAYDFEYNLTLAEERERHMFFIRAKRVF